jgi:hypothetical protein
MLRDADFDYAVQNLNFPRAYSVLRWIATVEDVMKNNKENTTE